MSVAAQNNGHAPAAELNTVASALLLAMLDAAHNYALEAKEDNAYSLTFFARSEPAAERTLLLWASSRHLTVDDRDGMLTVIDRSGAKARFVARLFR